LSRLNTRRAGAVQKCDSWLKNPVFTLKRGKKRPAVFTNKITGRNCKQLNNGQLLDGTKIQGHFGMLIGAVANPNLKPLELNILKLTRQRSMRCDTN